MKSDLVSLFAYRRLETKGLVTKAALRDVEASGILRTLNLNRPRRDQPYQTMQLAQFNFFLDKGLLASGADGRLSIRYERYDETVTALLREVLALQRGGDPKATEAFFTRWTTWTDPLHEALGRRLAAAEGPRYRIVRYAALGE
jgi:hypothetical protein